MPRRKPEMTDEPEPVKPEDDETIGDLAVEPQLDSEPAPEDDDGETDPVAPA
jgi:hypothetical protein